MWVFIATQFNNLDVCNINQKAFHRTWRRERKESIGLRMLWNVLHPRAARPAGKLNTLSILVLSPKAPRVSTTGRDPTSVLLLQIDIFKLIQTQSGSGRLQKMQRLTSLEGKGNTAVIVILFCIMQMDKQKDIKIKNYFLDSGRVSTKRATGRTPDLQCQAIIIRSYSSTWQLWSLYKAFHWYIPSFNNLWLEKFQTWFFYSPVLFLNKPVLIKWIVHSSNIKFLT